MREISKFPMIADHMIVNQRSSLLGFATTGAFVFSVVLALYFFVVLRSCGSDCGGDIAQSFTISGHIVAICGYAALASIAISGNRSAVLTPAFGFMLCCAIFFGFGNLSLILADQETLFYMMRSDYFISESDFLRANVQTFVGTATIFAFMRLGFRGRSIRIVNQGRSVSIRVSALLFLFVGITLKILVIVPAEWGYTNWTVPGTLINLQLLADVGFMLLAMAIVQGQRGLWILFAILWPAHLVICVLSFNKETMIIAILMPILGAFLAGIKLSKVVIGALVVAALFVGSQNTFLAARKQIMAFSGTERQSPIEDRVIILGQALGLSQNNDEIIVDGSALPPQLWWARLSYAGPQIRAIELFDNGQPLPLIFSPFQLLIPRIIWPDKPELTNLGLMFNREVSKNSETLGRVAFTIFGEGYWMLGWTGVLLFSGLTGLIFGIMTRKSQQWLEKSDFFYMPAILLSTKMGVMGALGYFQTGIALDFILFLLLVIGMGFLAPLWSASSAVRR